MNNTTMSGADVSRRLLCSFFLFVILTTPSVARTDPLLYSLSGHVTKLTANTRIDVWGSMVIESQPQLRCDPPCYQGIYYDIYAFGIVGDDFLFAGSSGQLSIFAVMRDGRPPAIVQDVAYLLNGEGSLSSYWSPFTSPLFFNANGSPVHWTRMDYSELDL